jgi:hypothetical protein
MSAVLEFLENLPEESLGRMYSDAVLGRFVCASVLRLVSSCDALIRGVVMRLLLLSEPVTELVIYGSKGSYLFSML